jgi:hypothetical protein
VTLFGRDLHSAVRKQSGLLPQPAQNVRLFYRDFTKIRGQRL